MSTRHKESRTGVHAEALAARREKHCNGGWVSQQAARPRRSVRGAGVLASLRQLEPRRVRQQPGRSHVGAVASGERAASEEDWRPAEGAQDPGVVLPANAGGIPSQAPGTDAGRPLARAPRALRTGA
eukprot:3474663-Prymnesium_polylepis.2